MTIRQQIERQIRIGDLQAKIAELEIDYQGKTVRPHSRLNLTRQQKVNQEQQLQSAFQQENQARQALNYHQ